MEEAVRAGPPADFEALRAGLLLSALAFAACEPADLPSPPTAPVIATLDEALAVESVITLGEDPADSIAEVGAFTERRAGGFVVADRLLPRVRSYSARYDHTRPFPPFKPLHSHLDIYDRHTGSRIYEDIPLPEGSKVLGGGRYLYLLLNKDFPPWRIAKLRLRR